LNNQTGKILGKIMYILIIIVIIYAIIKLYNICRKENFNDFIKAEYIPEVSEFKRDEEVKFSEANSYKIISEKNNDAMFYKTIEVEKNTPYKVTCMVKTENIKTLKEASNAGANICIADTMEKSKSIVGTNEWQELEFLFNSKNRTSISIGFRLGSYDDSCTGTAWFSDFSIEKGTKENKTHWKFVGFIIENTEVVVETNNTKKEVKLNMSQTDITDIKNNMDRFINTCKELTKNKMTAEYDLIAVKSPLTSLSYDIQNGYYVAPQNVKSLIQAYLEKKDYDHIFVIVRLGDDNHKNDIQVNNWIGLGGMEYQGLGFSNIRMPNSDKSYIYKYDTRINAFPEEVFIHEFLHTLERNSKEYGYNIPQLHDYEKYGYKEERLIGLKKWYQDYMNCDIKTQEGDKIGIHSDIYRYKPAHKEDFKITYKIEEFKEPQNFIEELKNIISKAIQNINIATIQKEENII
jgi:hypothetical protein